MGEWLPSPPTFSAHNSSSLKSPITQGREGEGEGELHPQNDDILHLDLLFRSD